MLQRQLTNLAKKLKQNLVHLNPLLIKTRELKRENFLVQLNTLLINARDKTYIYTFCFCSKINLTDQQKIGTIKPFFIPNLLEKCTSSREAASYPARSLFMQLWIIVFINIKCYALTYVVVLNLYFMDELPLSFIDSIIL